MTVGLSTRKQPQSANRSGAAEGRAERIDKQRAKELTETEREEQKRKEGRWEEKEERNDQK